MDALAVGAFGFLAGSTACGIAASFFELAVRRAICFAEPFVSGAHPARSAAVLLLAGPFMLGNDALAARRSGAISQPALALCAAAAAIWLTAFGIVLLALASGLSSLLT